MVNYKDYYCYLFNCKNSELERNVLVEGYDKNHALERFKISFSGLFQDCNITITKIDYKIAIETNDIQYK